MEGRGGGLEGQRLQYALLFFEKGQHFGFLAGGGAAVLIEGVRVRTGAPPPPGCTLAGGAPARMSRFSLPTFLLVH